MNSTLFHSINQPCRLMFSNFTRIFLQIQNSYFMHYNQNTFNHQFSNQNILNIEKNLK